MKPAAAHASSRWLSSPYGISARRCARPPPGACDTHCHIFGPGDKYPFAPDRPYTPPDAGLERFRALQAKLGLERAVIVNASCTFLIPLVAVGLGAAVLGERLEARHLLGAALIGLGLAGVDGRLWPRLRARISR